MGTVLLAGLFSNINIWLLAYANCFDAYAQYTLFTTPWVAQNKHQRLNTSTTRFLIFQWDDLVVCRVTALIRANNLFTTDLNGNHRFWRLEKNYLWQCLLGRHRAGPFFFFFFYWFVTYAWRIKRLNNNLSLGPHFVFVVGKNGNSWHENNIDVAVAGILFFLSFYFFLFGSNSFGIIFSCGIFGHVLFEYFYIFLG